jgi:iron complex transport system substrate-binding protein
MTEAAGPKRIVSFLPSATEMAYALGLGPELAAVSFECDWPPDAKAKPVAVRAALPVEHMSQREIDAAVSERVRSGQSLYQVDEALVRGIAPDLILTQDLCQVCAPSGNEVAELLRVLPSQPRVLFMTPTSLGQIFENLRELGDATGRAAQADALVASGQARLEKIEAITRGLPKPRVFCMEWIDPVYCCGHWVPEMVRIAGGHDGLGREGCDSVRISWEDVLDFAPEVLLVMPCGFHLEKAYEETRCLADYPGWDALPAARSGRAYAVDANAYFARPGPRVIEGTELLAHLLHPKSFDWTGPSDAYQPLLPRAGDAARAGSKHT